MKLAFYFNIKIWFVLVCFLSVFQLVFAEPATVIRVVDGDTLSVRLNGQVESVRLLGVDTPESHPNTKLYRDIQHTHRSEKNELFLGRKATQFTKSLVHPGDQIDLKFDVQKRDRYRRLLAYIYLKDGRCLNVILLNSGVAKKMSIAPNIHFPVK